MANFALQARHEAVRLRIVVLVFQLLAELLFCFLLALAKGVFEEALRASLLQGLLLENVSEQVLVSLYESL